MTPIPVPTAAVEQLRPYVQRLRNAQAAMSAAAALVLAGMDAPATAHIEIGPEGTMFLVVPDDIVLAIEAMEAVEEEAPGTGSEEEEL